MRALELTRTPLALMLRDRLATTLAPAVFLMVKLSIAIVLYACAVHGRA